MQPGEKNLSNNPIQAKMLTLEVISNHFHKKKHIMLINDKLISGSFL